MVQVFNRYPRRACMRAARPCSLHFPEHAHIVDSHRGREGSGVLWLAGPLASHNNIPAPHSGAAKPVKTQRSACPQPLLPARPPGPYSQQNRKRRVEGGRKASTAIAGPPPVEGLRRHSIHLHCRIGRERRHRRLREVGLPLRHAWAPSSCSMRPAMQPSLPATYQSASNMTPGTLTDDGVPGPQHGVCVEAI